MIRMMTEKNLLARVFTEIKDLGKHVHKLNLAMRYCDTRNAVSAQKRALGAWRARTLRLYTAANAVYSERTQTIKKLACSAVLEEGHRIL